jgi:hypothetical protein
MVEYTRGRCLRASELLVLNKIVMVDHTRGRYLRASELLVLNKIVIVGRPIVHLLSDIFLMYGRP